MIVVWSLTMDRLISLPIWANVNETARNKVLTMNSRLLKQWRHFEGSMDKPKSKKRKGKSGKASAVTEEEFYHEKNFLFSVLSNFKDFVASVDENSGT